MSTEGSLRTSCSGSAVDKPLWWDCVMDLHTLTIPDVYVQGVPRQALRRVDAVHPVRILALSIRNCATGRRGWPPAGDQMGSDRRSHRIVSVCSSPLSSWLCDVTRTLLFTARPSFLQTTEISPVLDQAQVGSCQTTGGARGCLLGWCMRFL